MLLKHSDKNSSRKNIYNLTKIDPWFLEQIDEIVNIVKKILKIQIFLKIKIF